MLGSELSDTFNYHVKILAYETEYGVRQDRSEWCEMFCLFDMKTFFRVAWVGKG